LFLSVLTCLLFLNLFMIMFTFVLLLYLRSLCYIRFEFTSFLQLTLLLRLLLSSLREGERESGNEKGGRKREEQSVGTFQGGILADICVCGGRARGVSVACHEQASACGANERVREGPGGAKERRGVLFSLFSFLAWRASER
jgi:hypothetical protein